MIVFKSVTKQFGPDSYGVVDVNFTISPGEFVIVTGKSGAGKTTLMRLLTKEYTPSGGEILFEDIDLNKLGLSQVHILRRRIGVVFQDYRLLPELNVWENIALPLSIIGQPQAEIEERVTDLLKLIGLTNKAELFPSQLSGGEAQRISIARALAVGPSVIFADEPTGNLDEETSESIAKLLHKINSLGTTVVVATHDPAVLDLFTNERHFHLEKGQLVTDTKSAAEPKVKEDNEGDKEGNEKKEEKEEKRAEASTKDAASPEEKSPQDTQPAQSQPSFWQRLIGSSQAKTPKKEALEDSEEPKSEELHVQIESLDESLGESPPPTQKKQAAVEGGSDQTEDGSDEKDKKAHPEKSDKKDHKPHKKETKSKASSEEPDQKDKP